MSSRNFFNVRMEALLKEFNEARTEIKKMKERHRKKRKNRLEEVLTYQDNPEDLQQKRKC